MYLRHADLSKYWVADIETDGLNPSHIWCLVAKNVATGQKVKAVGHEDVRRACSKIGRDYFIGHNFLSFDAPVLNRLLGLSIRVNQIVDTLVLSHLYNPRLEAGHSLGAWAVRLQSPVLKDSFDDFSQYSDQLLARCSSDVDINHSLFLHLTEKMKRIGYSEESCSIEHEIRHIINRQQRNGFRFDIPAATTLLGSLRGRQQALGETIKELFPPVLEVCHRYAKSRKSDGQLSKNYLRHHSQYPKVVETDDGGYEAWDWVEFDLASPQQRVEKLLSLGWKPTRWNKVSRTGRLRGDRVGSPKVDEESLVEAARELSEPKLQALADWLVEFGRGNMVETWLNSVDRSDSKIHGEINSCGAGSRRMTHNNPNTANIPNNEAKYGHECRSLWTASPGRFLVGYDAKGIQMRLLGHYCDMLNRDPDVYATYLGDPHTGNAEAIAQGETRRHAKNHFYAFIFGAHPPKLGAMVGKDARFGKYVTRVLFERTPGLEQATRDAQEEFDQTGGRLRCIDGGYVVATGRHAALNFQIQPAEACVMKKAAIFLDKEARREGIEHLKVGDIHDEAQHEVGDREVGENLGKLSARCIRQAGEHFNLRVPMDGDYKIGKTWAETH